MEEEFVEADRGTRLKIIILVAVVTVLILLERFTSPDKILRATDPAGAFKTSADRLLLVVFTAAAILFGASVYLFLIGIRTKRSGRWPPPDLRMAVRTKIRRGKYATWSWILLIAAAGIFMIQAFVGICAGYWVSRLANEPDPIFQANLNYLRRLVAREAEKDAQLSIANGDVGFLAAAGPAALVPAGEESDIRGCLNETDRVRIIRGTADVAHAERYRALLRQAAAYAARYNAVIAKHRGLTVAGGCRPSNGGVQRTSAGGRR